MNYGLLKASIDVGNERLENAVAQALGKSASGGTLSTSYAGEVGQILKKIQTVQQQSSGGLSQAQMQVLGALGQESQSLISQARSTNSADPDEQKLIEDLSTQLSTAIDQITVLTSANAAANRDVKDFTDKLNIAQKETAALKAESKKLVEDMKIALPSLRSGGANGTVRENVIRMSSRLNNVEADLKTSMAKEASINKALVQANAQLVKAKKEAVVPTNTAPAQPQSTGFFGGSRDKPTPESPEITVEQAVKNRIKLLADNTTDSLYKREPAIDEIKQWYLSQPGKVEIPGYDLYWTLTLTTIMTTDRSWTNLKHWSYEKNRVVAASEKAAADAAAAAERAPADAALKAAQIKAAAAVEAARLETEASKNRAQEEADASLPAAEAAAAADAARDQAAAAADAARDQAAADAARDQAAAGDGGEEDIITDLVTRMKLRLQSWKEPSRAQLAHTYGRYIYVDGKSLVANLALAKVIPKDTNEAIFKELDEEGILHVQSPSSSSPVDITLWNKETHAPVNELSNIIDAAEEASGKASTETSMTYLLLYLIHKIGLKDESGTVLVEPNQVLIGKAGASYEQSPFSSMFLWM